MRNLRQLTPLIFLIGLTGAARAQTVYAGESTIENVKAPGLYLTVQGDGRQIEKDWESQLKTYGRVTASRGLYRVPNANVPSVSPEPVNVMSTVKSSRRSAAIFVAFDLGSGNFVRPGGTGYSAAEQILKEFAARSLFGQEVRGAESGFDDAQKTHQKMVKTGERLQREMEQNAKDKERLLNRIEENAKELEQLRKDIETNKTDQATALTELENRKANVEAVKKKN